MPAIKSSSAQLYSSILGLMVTVILIMSLSGCAVPSNPDEAAKTALSGYLTKIQSKDIDDQLNSFQSQYGSFDMNSEEGKAYINAWLDGFSYEIGSAAMDGNNTCNIQVSITCKNLATAMAQGFGKALTNAFTQAFTGADQEAIQQQTEQILMDEMDAVEPATTEITVPMELVNGNWVLSENGKMAILDAMTGDLASLQNQLSQLGELQH